MNTNEIVKRITDFFLESPDFNGISGEQLLDESGLTIEDFISELETPIREKKISVAFESIHPNPHIKAFPPLEPDKQIEKLKEEGLGYVCFYPEYESLKDRVNPDDYKDKPYTLRLLRGEPEILPIIYFNSVVLEPYYNDPRYFFKFEDYTGHLYLKEEYLDNEDEDFVFLKTFGLGYSQTRERVVASFLRYLHDLPPEHQKRWELEERKDKCKVAEPYYVNNVIGDWADYVSINEALLTELQVINEMCEAMGKPHLFRDDFQKGRPKEFTAFLRPTLKNYHDFLNEFDKMVSQNLNLDFFRGEVPLEIEEERKDGKIKVRQKGTLSLLDEYLRKRIRVADDSVFDLIIDPLKKLRRLRQPKAHKIEDDKYDQEYFAKQNEIIQEVYKSIRHIRLLFTNHPKARNVKVPKWLFEGKIDQY